MDHSKLQKIQRVIDFVWDNPHSSFYRDHWNSHGITEKPLINTEQDLAQLPFLNRADLAQTPHPNDRLFVPITDVTVLRSTSGTSKQGPLSVWKHNYYHEDAQRVSEAGHTRSMLFANYEKMDATLGARREGVSMIMGNPRDLPHSLGIMIDTGITVFSTTASLAVLIGTELEQLNQYNKQITHVDLGGELCTENTERKLRELFPNATIANIWGSSESTSIMAYTAPECPQLRYLHIEDNVYAEIDNNELVITTLEVPNSLPLIRYRTGDHASSDTNHVCGCGRSGPMVEPLGRINVDFVRIAGFEIRAESLERIISAFPYLQTEYAAIVSESVKNDTQHITFSLQVYPTTQAPLETIIQEEVRDSLLQSLFISSTTTLGDALEKNLFNEVIVSVSDKPTTEAKRSGIRLISQ